MRCIHISYSELTNSQLKEVHDVFETCLLLGFFKEIQIFDELSKINWLGKEFVKEIEYHKENRSHTLNIYNSLLFSDINLKSELAERFLKMI